MLLFSNCVGPWTGQDLYRGGESSPRKQSPSFGDLIDHLRRHCRVMRTLMLAVQRSIAPHSFAVLNMLLLAVDASKRGVLLPSQLLKELKVVSPATRLITGTGLAPWLTKLSTDVRVLVNTRDQCISDVILGKTEYEPHHRRLSFTLPITFEELVAKYACDNMDDNIDLLKSKLLTLEGMIHVFTKELTLAQESFILSLKVLENMGLEMEVVACELYNSIAQLMVTKHRDWNDENKKRVRAECMAWLSSSDGQLALQLEIVKLTKANTKIAKRMNQDEIDMKAYKNIYQARVKSKLAGIVDPTVTSVEAASR